MRTSRVCLLGMLALVLMGTLAQAETYTLKGPGSWFDTFVSYSYDDKYDDEAYFRTREYWRTDNSYDFRTFIRIDLASVPVGLRVASATLYLNVRSETVNTTDVVLDVWEVSPFTTDVRAASCDGTNPWPNGVFDGVDGYYETPADRLLASSSYNTSLVGTYMEISGPGLTSYVGAQARATSDRYLYLELSCKDAGATNIGTWSSSEDLESVQPYLVIEEAPQPTEMAEGDVPTVDGDLSDWADAEWINLDQVAVESLIEGMDVNENEVDISNAKFAVRWSSVTNKIYLAASCTDTQQNLAYADDIPTFWPYYYDADQLMVYVDAADLNNPYYCYSVGLYQEAQQYAGGRDDEGGSYMALGGPNGVMDILPDGSGIVSAFETGVAGDTLTYEMEITPYEFLNIQWTNDDYDVSGVASSTIRTLEADMIVGLDVKMVSLFSDSNYYNGCATAYWWDGEGEWRYAGSFPDWVLTSDAALIPGDANGDGAVDVGDLGILAANYGTVTGATWELGDFTGDGAVDVGDLGVLAANYGTGTSGADFEADYAKVFDEGEAEAEDADVSTLCGGLGLPLIAGLVLMGLMLVKLEE